MPLCSTGVRGLGSGIQKDDSVRTGATHGTPACERDVAPEGAQRGGAGHRRLVRPRRGLPRDRPGLRARSHAAEQPNQRRGDRHRPHLADPRHARRLEVRPRPDRRRLRPRQPPDGGREDPRQRLLREEDGQALRRRHGIPRLQGAARGQGRRRRPRQHPGPLARAPRDRGRGGRQGRLPAEADVPHDRRGPGAQRTRSTARGASSRSAASSGPPPSSASRRSWCATGASGS